MSQVPARYESISTVSRLTSYCKRLIPFFDQRDVTSTLPMSIQQVDGQNLQRCMEQVERIAESPVLRNSEALSKLLRYLARHSLESPNNHLKEYQIATEVLGRSVEFDPQTDASVRVQIGRLRSRLAEYYKSLGTEDSILITLPKGAHSLSFEFAELPKGSKPKTEFDTEAVPDSNLQQHPQRMIVLIALITAVITSCSLLLAFHIWNRKSVIRQQQLAAVPRALSVFWAPFLRSNDGPFVIYSDAWFVGNPISGMRYFNPARDTNQHVTPYYTGVGEVMGAVELDNLFHAFGKSFRLKRSGLFTLDDALNNDLIFLGSPVEDAPLRAIPNTQEFVLRRPSGDTSRWWDIIDTHPPKGASGVYRNTLRDSNATGKDFALVAFLPGLGSSHSILILEGISTLGTQAAVHFVCTPSSVQELLDRLGIKKGSPMPYFEALLKVDVANNVPLQTQLLAVRKR